MKILKIQSESDLITNSSSEAFMVIDKNSITRVKQAAASLLKLMHIDDTIDNVLEIQPAYDEYKKAIEHLILTGKYDPDYDSLWNLDDESYDMEGYPVCNDVTEITPEIFEKAMYDFMQKNQEYPFIHDIVIKPKKPEYTELAKSIYDIIYSIPYEAFYC